jgi:hypothetical protein
MRIQSGVDFSGIHGVQGAHDIQGYLDIVQNVAKHMDKSKLQTMTFQQLCTIALGEQKAVYVQAAFGYNAEFELMNAYDASVMFASDFSLANTVYYICKDGLTSLVDHMEADLTKKCTIIKSTTITSIAYEDTYEDTSAYTKSKHFLVYDSNGKTYTCSTLVAALPKQALLKLPIFNTQQRRLLNSVHDVSLNRIYAAWDNEDTWFKHIGKTTTSNHIRQFIPINSNTGLAMVSYSDTKDADFWFRKAKNEGEEKLWKSLSTHLTKMFGKPIPYPSWVKYYYWSDGVHVWKSGVDSDVYVKLIRHIQGSGVPFYIVGEAYCKHQGWIEGALQSVDELMSDIRRRRHL